MPLTKSAKKALIVSHRRKAENDLVRAKVKGATKAVKIGIRLGEDGMASKLGQAYHELDIAAKKHVIHKNKAARLKSRLAQSLAKAELPSETKKIVKKTVAKKTAAKKTTRRKPAK
ncbi:MAG: 30S ribosomal protein S20 [Patescibacteria group bacterium]